MFPFNQVTQNGEAYGAVAETFIALISSGFGQSVVIVIIVGVILWFVLKVFSNSNKAVGTVLDRLLPPKTSTDVSSEVYERLLELENQSAEKSKALKELEGLPKKVERLSLVIDEVKKIVGSDSHV